MDVRRANFRDKIGREVVIGDTVLDTGLQVEWEGVVRHPHFKVCEDEAGVYLLIASNEEGDGRIYLDEAANGRIVSRLLVVGSN